MFFVIARVIIMVLMFLALAYAYISWVRREEIRSEVSESIRDINNSIQLYESLPNIDTKLLKKAQERLKKLVKS